jgi:MoaA/NifB/PqqE/SkfB family radical SAM enzyme
MMTNLCNARCVHCEIWKNKGREDALTADEYKKVLSDIRAWLGPVEVSFTGGEALLRPYAPEVVAHASAIGLYVEVLTHGYWDDQSRIEKLARANPGRVTVSLDGIGEAHSRIRGRENFFEKTTRSIETLLRVRQESGLGYVIRLKTVIMSHNLHDVANVARYAAQHGMEIFYQAIEQNYNTLEDQRWFDHSENWPRDTGRAVEAVRELIRMKQEGFPIRNSMTQLGTMIPYFQDPDSMRVSIQAHGAHEKRQNCDAVTNLQILPNGDITNCCYKPPVGNLRTASIRAIWDRRPKWWLGGCCLETRLSAAEKERLGLVKVEN